MEDFEIENINGTSVINSYLTRATIKEAQHLKNLIDEEIIFDHFNMVIDLSLCEFIDSTFLGVLVYTHKKLAGNNGKLKIVLGFYANSDLFFITSAFKFLNIFDTREEALNDSEVEGLVTLKEAS